uniref:Uncharacterized protein n=1 Tax=Micrurus surinamensis TaxID=129470 RepID=A0A2D4Q338_MICSU
MLLEQQIQDDHQEKCPQNGCTNSIFDVVSLILRFEKCINFDSADLNKITVGKIYAIDLPLLSPIKYDLIHFCRSFSLCLIIYGGSVFNISFLNEWLFVLCT